MYGGHDDELMEGYTTAYGRYEQAQADERGGQIGDGGDGGGDQATDAER